MEDGAEAGLGHAVIRVAGGDEVRQGLRVVGPPGQVDPVELCECLGELLLARGEVPEQLALLARTQDPGVGIVQDRDLLGSARLSHGAHGHPSSSVWHP